VKKKIDMNIWNNAVSNGYQFYIIQTIHRFLTISLLCLTTSAIAADDADSYIQCTQNMMIGSQDSVTIGEIKQSCKEQPALTQLEKRIEAERIANDNKFLLSTHKPNYILLIAHNEDTNEDPFELQFPDDDTAADDTEVKFQISAKYPLAFNLLGENTLYFAYTNRSFWQLYNENSAPFRETNHEPEIFLLMPTDWELFGFKNSFINLGFVHQSNGRGGTLSRSWNRIYASFLFEKDDFLLVFKPWYRIEEDIEDDDNPDIEDYLGKFELTGVYKAGNHTLSAMIRNSLDSNNNSTIQLDWVFPFTRTLGGYIQYFNGYGESLIDYNYKQESIGIGVALSGWL
jgi:phospholipase A1